MTNEQHGVLNLDYYYRCVDSILGLVVKPHFFIFSDDPEWARINLKLSHPSTIVDHNGVEKNYEDLRLMSQCRYYIIANSTFSWWGAWLCKKSEKIVFAPQKWFQDKSIDTRDLIPNGWKIVNSASL